ncbi:hypothetical protein, partial [Klebsiella pneumoniae]|uniref:hypothetical protein n=1 Tax=Klebsiella pneumoniae TaxID=573 RepID=UPI00197ABF4A
TNSPIKMLSYKIKTLVNKYTYKIINLYLEVKHESCQEDFLVITYINGERSMLPEIVKKAA